jgi:hypothetical protein
MPDCIISAVCAAHQTGPAERRACRSEWPNGKRAMAMPRAHAVPRHAHTHGRTYARTHTHCRTHMDSGSRRWAACGAAARGAVTVALRPVHIGVARTAALCVEPAMARVLAPLGGLDSSGVWAN